jgi:PTS system nitrogen regulatory IIA component
MKIMAFLEKKAISIDLKSTAKKDVIEELLDLLIKAGTVKPKDKQKLLDDLFSREELGSTGIGQGIGIPHAKSDSIGELVGSFGISKKGVGFDSLDGEQVYIFFLLLAPKDSAGPHLKALARISRLLKDKYVREELKQAKTAEDVLRLMKREDEKQE